MNTNIYIDGGLRTDLRCARIMRSYVQPWSAELIWDGRHDAEGIVNGPCGLVDPWGDVIVEDAATGQQLFRGKVVDIAPGGVGDERAVVSCMDRRQTLDGEFVQINNSFRYFWNRRGHTCSEGKGGEDSPGRDGGKWTCGEIIIDILEHALNLPLAGSDIPGHHSDYCSIRSPYLSADDIAGYNALAILARDSVVGEFSVNGTSVADAISLLLALNGEFSGWYIDPATGQLVVLWLDALAATDLEAGELGLWQDAAGTDYVLLGNDLEWSLDGVYSTVIIQGTDRTVEEQPANIEGSGNPGLGNRGEMELVAAPWKDFEAAYHALCQPKRHFVGKSIDPTNTYTPPDGYMNFLHLPRLYRGTDAGPKTVYSPNGVVWRLPCGNITFDTAPVLGVDEKLWGWYWAKLPFLVTAGPDGDAYNCYGYERSRCIYDPAFRHATSWPQVGTADDQVAMEELAGRLLRLFRDVRRQGVLRCDEVDFASFNLTQRYNVANLAEVTEAGPTTSTSGCVDPMRWRSLGLNAVDVLYDFDSDSVEITVANTFWMLEEYSELKRRLEMNLFAQREMALSEDIYDCQVKDSEIDDEEDVPITTEGPVPTTAGPWPTTAGPGPTTEAEPTTAEAGSTTSEPPPGSTTTKVPVEPLTSTAGASTSSAAPASTTTEAGPGSTTTEGPSPTPSAGPTSAAPTSTTEAWGVNCPDDDWCADECPFELFMLWPADCGAGYKGTITWTYWDHCTWDWVGAPPGVGAGDIVCAGGTWYLWISGPGWGCWYEKPANSTDCPTGTWSKVGASSPCCPSEIDVYE